jgi:hypothetical protein
LTVTSASAIALLIETAKPGAVFGMVLISDFGTAFWSISLSLNVISTTLIAGKLMWHQRSLRQAGIPQSDQYMSIAAILAESAALYSISGLIYIPLFARDLTLQYPFSALFNSAAVRIELFYHIPFNNTDGVCGLVYCSKSHCVTDGARCRCQ